MNDQNLKEQVAVPLSESEQAAVSGGSGKENLTSQNSMPCPYCHKISTNVLICSFCGANLVTNDPGDRNCPPPRRY